MFDQEKIELQETVDARKEQVADEKAWKLLNGADEIIVGKGKKYLIFNPSKDKKEEILSQCLGRTGNLRAPTLKIGNRYVVGFNEDMYQKYVA